MDVKLSSAVKYNYHAAVALLPQQPVVTALAFTRGCCTKPYYCYRSSIIISRFGSRNAWDGGKGKNKWQQSFFGVGLVGLRLFKLISLRHSPSSFFPTKDSFQGLIPLSPGWWWSIKWRYWVPSWWQFVTQYYFLLLLLLPALIAPNSSRNW